jgi:phosphoribosylformylglycinamidine synthase subunit PurL
MEPWEIMISESQERMVAVLRPAVPRPRTGRLRPLGARPRSDRRGHRHGDAPRVPRGRVRRRDPRAPADRRGPRYASRRSRARSDVLASAARRRRLPPTPCSSCSPRRTCAAAPPSTAATTSSSARARCAARGSTPPSCASARPSAAWPSRSTQPRSRRLEPVHGRARSRCSRRRETWPAPAAEPLALHGLPQLRQPGEAGVGWELSEAIEGMAQACEALGDARSSPGTCRSTTRRTGGRSIRPPWSGRSGSSRTCGVCRGAGARATRSSSRRRPGSRSRAPSTRRASARPGARPHRSTWRPRHGS